MHLGSMDFEGTFFIGDNNDDDYVGFIFGYVTLVQPRVSVFKE